VKSTLRYPLLVVRSSILKVIAVLYYYFRIKARAIANWPLATLSVSVRDEERAKSVFSSLLTPEDCKTIDWVVGTIARDSCSSSFSTAVRNSTVIINCLSSCTARHNQMSSLIKLILAVKPRQCRLVHFGYQRGLGPSGTRSEDSCSVSPRPFRCLNTIRRSKTTSLS